MTQISPTSSRRWWALALLATTQFIVVLDMTIVNVALPSIKDAVGFSDHGLQWVVNAYLLTFGGFLLLGGRIADLVGRRRVFVLGQLVFGLASLAVGLTEMAGMVVAARAAQGLGAALLAPTALSLVATIFTNPDERNRAMGVWAAVAGSGGAVGVLLGGILTDQLSWEWVFWVNVPVALAAAALTPLVIPESRDEQPSPKLDITGAVTVTGGLLLFVYALVSSKSVGRTSLHTLALLAAAVLLLAAFLVIERRSAHPLVELRLFRHRSVSVANLAMLIFSASMFTMMYFLSLYMQQVLGYTPLQTGLAFLPQGIGIIVFSQIAGTLLGRLGTRTTLTTGLGVASVSLAWFAGISTDGNFAVDVLGPSVLYSVGAGLAFVAIASAAVSEVPAEDSGLASGLINVNQQIGSALGLAVVATLAASHTDRLAEGAIPGPLALTSGFRFGYLLGAALAALAALFVVIAAPRTRAPGRTEEAGRSIDTESPTSNGRSS